MMKKLFHFQFNENWRLIKPALLAIVSLLVVNLIVTFANIYFLSVMMTIFTVLIIIALVYFAYGLVAMNDYKNFYGERSYFVQAIPATTKDKFWSRFWNYFCVVFIVGFAITVTLAVLGIVVIKSSDLPLRFVLEDIFRNLKNFIVPFLFFTAVMILSFVISVLYLMFAVTAGSDQKLHKLGFAGPIVMYIALNFVVQILAIIFIILVPIYTLIEPDPNNLNRVSMNVHFGGIWEFLFDTQSQAMGFMPLGFLILFVILLVVLPVIIYKLMDKRTSIK